VTLEEAQDMTNAYLLPDVEDDEEQANHIRFRAKKFMAFDLAGDPINLQAFNLTKKLDRK